MQPLEVDHDVRENAVVVKVKGDVDSLSVYALNNHLAKARDKLKTIKDQESQEAKDLKTSIAALEKDLENSQKSTATAGGTAVVAVPETRDSNLTAANVQTITAAVTTLALEVIRNNKADMMFTCSDVLQSRPYILKTELDAQKKAVNFTPLETACRDYVKAKLDTETSEANLQFITNDLKSKTLNPAMYQKLMNLRESEKPLNTTQ